MQERIQELHRSGLTHRQIANSLGISKSTVGYRLSQYKGDTRWPPVTKTQEQVILGTLLGDSSIIERQRKNNTDYSVQLGHGEEQLPYLKLKHKLLQSQQKILKRIRKPGDGGFEGGKPYHRFSFCHARYLPEIYKLCVDNEIKTVTRQWLDKLEPLAIAIWFQDDGYAKMGGSRRKDGSHKQPLVYLATNGFTHAELQIIINYFEAAWEIRFNKTRVGKSKDGQQLVARNRAAKRFIRLVSPFMFLDKYCETKPDDWGSQLEKIIQYPDSIAVWEPSLGANTHSPKKSASRPATAA